MFEVVFKNGTKVQLYDYFTRLSNVECYFMKYPEKLEKFLDHILAEEVGYDQY